LHLAGFCIADGDLYRRDKWKQVIDPDAFGYQNDDDQRRFCEVLFEQQTLIGSHEGFEPVGSSALQQDTVTKASPALLLRGADIVAGQMPDQPAWQLFIQQNAHER